MVSCTLDTERSRRQFTMLSDLTIDPAAFLMLMVVTPLYMFLLGIQYVLKDDKDLRAISKVVTIILFGIGWLTNILFLINFYNFGGVDSLLNGSIICLLFGLFLFENLIENNKCAADFALKLIKALKLACCCYDCNDVLEEVINDVLEEIIIA